MKLPENFTPPVLKKDHYIARKLCGKDVYLDYIAVMSSIDIIKKTRGGSWPDPSLTFEDDFIDLCWHQREFESKSSLAYTVVNKEETECLGCFYIYKMGFRTDLGEKNKDFDIDLSWWVTQKMYDQGFYEVLITDLIQWFKQEWPPLRIYFSNLILPDSIKN